MPENKLVEINTQKVSVAWFASGFIGRSASGTAQTARKLVEFLLEHKFEQIEVNLIVKSVDEANLIKNDQVLSKSIVVILPDVHGNFLRSSRQFYKYILLNKKAKFDVVHFSVARLYPFFWKFPAKKFFCTFHAGGEITVPQDKFILSRHLYNFIIKLSWRKLDRIFADSKFGIDEIALNYHIPNRKIDLIHLGADHLWRIKPKKIELDLTKLNICVVGRWQQYKNVHSVLQAFMNLPDDLKSTFRIILIGKSNRLGNQIVQQVLDTMDKDFYTLYDYLPDNELKYIYRNADLVIHPSINEGFGLPAFEAFGEGAPISIHLGTPADFYLSGEEMVFAINMLDQEKIIELFKKIRSMRRVDITTRRKFLKDHHMTWKQICSQYSDYYLNLDRC